MRGFVQRRSVTGRSPAPSACSVLARSEPAPVQFFRVLDVVVGVGHDVFEEPTMQREPVVRVLLTRLYRCELAVDKTCRVITGRCGSVVDDLQCDGVSRSEPIDQRKDCAESGFFAVCRQRRIADIEVLLNQV